ncbi:uncharacterized protein LOC144659146 [Oculina patagonica]
MDNIQIVTDVIFIGIVVATFLRTTGRGLKAVEFCKECLILLNNKGPEMEEETAKISYFAIYYTMFMVYSFIADCTSYAIQYGKKVLFISRECSKTATVAMIMAGIYQSQNKHTEAKELYNRAIDIMIKTGDRKREADAYCKLGSMLYQLGELRNAQQYIEKEQAIRIEIKDRAGEATSYGNLGTVLSSLGEYRKAKEYLEKALAIRIETEDRSGEAADYGVTLPLRYSRYDYII